MLGSGLMLVYVCSHYCRFLDNQIYRNSHAGVVTEKGCSPHFEGNAIFEGETDGVNCSSYSSPVFLRNNIAKNAMCGVVVTRCLSLSLFLSVTFFLSLPCVAS
jgi:hypothetical protein